MSDAESALRAMESRLSKLKTVVEALALRQEQNDAVLRALLAGLDAHGAAKARAVLQNLLVAAHTNGAATDHLMRLIGALPQRPGG